MTDVPRLDIEVVVEIARRVAAGELTHREADELIDELAREQS